MRSRKVLTGGDVCSNATAILGAAVLLLLGGTAALAQAPASGPPAQHAMADSTDQNKQLSDQVTELRAQVARLESAVHQAGSGKKTNPKSGMKTGPAPDKGMGMGMAPRNTARASGSDPGGMAPAAMPPAGGGMSMMGDKGEMGAMPPGGKPAMPPGSGGMGMMSEKPEMGGMPPGGRGSMPPAPAAAMGMMGEMSGMMSEMSGMSGSASGGMSGMAGGAAMSATSSAMPGQPGASHLYHVGSTGFFLNHSQHITLTADQKFTLNRIKERAMFDRASAQRKIDQAEQELYALTGADQLDTPRVQTKIGEIERLRAEQRLNFIRAVGEAANALTHDQHQALIGTMAAGKP